MVIGKPITNLKPFMVLSFLSFFGHLVNGDDTPLEDLFNVKSENDSDIPASMAEDLGDQNPLVEYLRLLEDKKAAIEKFFEETYGKFDPRSVDPLQLVKHPIDAFLLMKRMAVTWRIHGPALLNYTKINRQWENIRHVHNHL